MREKLSIILVNYNGKKYNDKCIASVLKSEGVEEIQIVVVDNASTDGSLELLRERWGGDERVCIIPLDQNYGYSRANNIGIRWAAEHGYQYVMLLNNDTEIEPWTVKKMLDCQRKTGGIIVPKILYADKPDVIWCAGGFFTPVVRKAIQRGAGRKDMGQYEDVEKCAFANGCCMLLTQEIISRVGLLDESFFLYYEDTEYSMRAAEKNTDIVFCGGAIVYHKVNGATRGNENPANAYYITRNWLMCNRKHMGGRFWLFLMYFILNRAAWGIIWIAQGRGNMVTAMLKGIGDYVRGRKNNNCAEILKRILFLGGVAFFLLCIWKISVSGGYRPIEQRTEDGWFQGMNYEIRSIRLYVETQYRNVVVENPRFTVWITDEEGKTIWKENFHDMALLDGEFLILEEYERGEGIEIGSGRYRIYDTLPDDQNVRINYRVLFYDGDYRTFYFTSTMIALLFLAVILAVTMKGGWKEQFAFHYFLALMLMGILFSVVMPPLTVPDEESHFRRAYDVSSQILFQSRELMRKTDNDSITYLHNAASAGRWHEEFMERADVTEVVNTKWSSVPGSTPSYAYLFPALGISAARICGLNGHWAILLGRIFNLAGVAAIMALALHLVPFGKEYFCVFGLLPEVVYIFASYSYDALNMALCFLVIAYFFYMISDGRKVRFINVLIFLVLVLLMIPVKLVYAPLAGLILLTPRRQLEINRKILIGFGAVGILGIAFFLLLRWNDIVVLLQGLVYNAEGEERVSLRYMVENPESTIFVFLNNMMCNFDYYLKSIAGEFVGRDRYGVLLDIAYLPDWMMITLGIVLAMGISTDQKPGLCPWKKLWLIFLGAASCFLVLLSMYLANNSPERPTIHGVQGRYFLPPLLLLPALFGKKGEETGTAGSGISRNACLILAVGIDILAIFIQFQHMAMDYYG